jgi:hypothetical protein
MEALSPFIMNDEIKHKQVGFPLKLIDVECLTIKQANFTSEESGIYLL